MLSEAHCCSAETADNSLVSLQSHVCKLAFHTCLQMPNTDAQLVGPGQETCFQAHCCSAKRADRSLVSLQSHLCNFAFHRGLQMPNTDAQQVCPGQETCFQRLTAALQKQLTTAWCHYSHTYASLPYIQVCKCPTQMHSRFAQDRKHAFRLCKKS